MQIGIGLSASRARQRLSFSNGDFSGGTAKWGGFRLGVGRDDSWLSVASGQASVSSGGAGQPPIIAQRVTGFVVGQTYRLGYDRIDGGGSVTAYLGFWTVDYTTGATGPAETGFTNFQNDGGTTTVATHTHDWVATQGWAWVGARRAAIGAALTVDNFTLVRL